MHWHWRFAREPGSHCLRQLAAGLAVGCFAWLRLVSCLYRGLDGLGLSDFLE